MLALFLILFFGGCTAPVQLSVKTPQGSSQAYPPFIEDTAGRKQAAEEAWKKFLVEMRLPDTPPDWEPLLYTPRALPAPLAGRIYLNTRGVVYDAMEAKESLRRFLEKARSIMGSDSAFSLKDLSLISFTNDGNFYRATYRQASYPVPIAKGYGELRLTVGKDGTLLQWNSRLIPKYEIPTRPEVSTQSIVDKLRGREFSYTSIAGQPMSIKVTQRADLSLKDLIIFPKLDGTRMSIHLAYPVVVGNGMTWTVFIDAINGQELGVVQNFAT